MEVRSLPAWFPPPAIIAVIFQRKHRATDRNGCLPLTLWNTWGNYTKSGKGSIPTADINQPYLPITSETVDNELKWRGRNSLCLFWQMELILHVIGIRPICDIIVLPRQYWLCNRSCRFVSQVWGVLFQNVDVHKHTRTKIHTRKHTQKNRYTQTSHFFLAYC